MAQSCPTHTIDPVDLERVLTAMALSLLLEIAKTDLPRNRVKLAVKKALVWLFIRI